MRRLAEEGDYPALIARIPYAHFLGIEVEAEGNDRRYRLPFDEHLLGNPVRGSLHGGVIAGFAENAALVEVLVGEEQNRIPKPVDFSIDYLRRGRPVTSYAAVAIVRQGRRTVLARVDCWQGQRQALMAQARVHMLLEDFW